jgi:hypothetical protein
VVVVVVVVVWAISKAWESIRQNTKASTTDNAGYYQLF